MKATKKNTTLVVRMKLGSDPVWALKALVRIFQENQTYAEQAQETVTEDNGIGFTGTDGKFLSSLAKQYISRGSLSPKQMTFVLKSMPKYHAQVIAFSDETKLTAIVEKA